MKPKLYKRLFRKILFLFIIPLVIYSLVIGEFYLDIKITYALTHLPIIARGAVTTCLVQQRNGLLQVNDTGPCGPEPCHGLWSCSQQMCQVFNSSFELHDTAMISVTPFANLSKTNPCDIEYFQSHYIKILKSIIVVFYVLYMIILIVILVWYCVKYKERSFRWIHSCCCCWIHSRRCCRFVLAFVIVSISLVPVVASFVIDYYTRKDFDDNPPPEIHESECVLRIIRYVAVVLEAIHRIYELDITLKNLSPPHCCEKENHYIQINR